MGEKAINSKLTQKYQATIPEPVRRALKLTAGDVINFQLSGDGEVMLRKAQPLDMTYIQALESTLGEWTTEEDEKAYRDL